MSDSDNLLKDAKHLGIVDDLIGNSNLLTTLEQLSRWGFFVDPVLSAPEPFPIRSYYRKYLEQGLHPWAIAYFAMVCLKRANVHRSGELKPDRFIKAINSYKEVSGPLPDNSEQIRSAFIRLAFQQFPYRRQWWTGMSRTRFMYGRSNSSHTEFLAELINDLWGVTIDELLTLCLLIYFSLRHKISLQKECFLTKDEIGTGFLPWVDKEVLAAVLSSLSQTQDEFKARCAENEFSDRSLKIFDLNPLLTKPLIRFGDRYYAPLPMLVPVWATSGIVYTLLKHTTLNKADGSFGNTLGHAFEDYIAYLLDSKGIAYIPEIPFKIGRNEVKSADYIIVEDKAAIIFDCKSRRVNRDHRGGIINETHRDYEEAIIKGIKQSIQTEDWIRCGIEPLCSIPLLSSVENYLHAVVTMDDYYLSNSWIQEDVNLDSDKHEPFQVLSVHEFELLLYNLPKGTIISAIRKKAESPETSSMSYRDYCFYLKDEERVPKVVDPSKDFVLSVLADLKSKLQHS